MTKIYWLTGQPGSGKTTLSTYLKRYLVEVRAYNPLKIIQIDGDGLRDMTLNYDYSKKGRDKNISNAQTIASFLQKSGYTVIVSLVSPYREAREKFKTAMGDDIVEFYVHTSEVRERDEYKVENYEPPLDNFVEIDTTTDTTEQSLQKIIKCL